MPEQKVALITGANKGIGFEIARQLGERRICTLAGARDEKRGLAAASALAAQGLPAVALRIDVTDDASVSRCPRISSGRFTTPMSSAWWR